MGFGAKQSTLVSVKAETDNIPGLLDSIARKYPFLDFWSSPTSKITIASTPIDLTFPSVVVSGLPSGLTVRKVALILTARAIYDSSGVDNYIKSASKTLRIKVSTGAWGLDDIVGITFALNSLYTIGTYKESGPVIVGSHDIKSVVTGDGTYNIMSNETSRSDALASLGDSLELYDIQTGLRVFFS
jgi:hypothetical protein